MMNWNKFCRVGTIKGDLQTRHPSSSKATRAYALQEEQQPNKGNQKWNMRQNSDEQKQCLAITYESDSDEAVACDDNNSDFLWKVYGRCALNSTTEILATGNANRYSREPERKGRR